MQFKITFQCLTIPAIVPLNYQYELSAWIYKVIEQADAGYANFLHQKGYETPHRKSFKLFSFSHLQAARFRVVDDRLYIERPEVSLLIGFYMDRTAEEFIKGLFTAQQFKLGDRISQADLEVKSVVMRPISLPSAGTPVHIRAKSPIVVALKQPDNQERYLSPDEPDFGKLFYANLLEKYRAATANEIPEDWNPDGFTFVPVGLPPKSKLIHLKSGKKEATKVRGWLFDFELCAPPELIEIGLLAGFGKYNAQGFGFGVVV